MSTYFEEAAMAHGADNPTWNVTFLENFSGKEITIKVSAAEYQQAVNKATQRLNIDFSKPEGSYYFKRCAEVR